jgi:hypothetical protein
MRLQQVGGHNMEKAAGDVVCDRSGCWEAPAKQSLLSKDDGSNVQTKTGCS